MSKREVILLLEDMLEAIDKIIRFTEGLDFNSFIDDEKTVDAVVRNFEIIGEAANILPEEFKTTHWEIEWYKIIGLRNRIIHEYFGVDLSILWKIKMQN